MMRLGEVAICDKLRSCGNVAQVEQAAGIISNVGRAK
jgi:hypothetical protein